MIAKIKEIKKKATHWWNYNLVSLKIYLLELVNLIFLKLQAELGKAMMNINAAKVLNMEAVLWRKMTGKEHNDLSSKILPTKPIFLAEFKVEFQTEWIFISE